ncbi:MAG: serine hydrolase domain-containing protein [Phycisphaerales bacterium]
MPCTPFFTQRFFRTLVLPAALLSCALAAASTIAQSATEAPAAPVATHAIDDLDARLERLIADLDRQRETLHIPGLAIAIVKDGEVILARGVGVRNIESGEPVTPQTIFAVGSTTKAFTAALIGMLVDEGKMSWDAPAHWSMRELFLLCVPVVAGRELCCFGNCFESGAMRHEIAGATIDPSLLDPESFVVDAPAP